MSPAGLPGRLRCWEFLFFGSRPSSVSPDAFQSGLSGTDNDLITRCIRDIDARFKGLTMSMSIIAWIVLGLIAGIIAKSLLGGRAKHGIIVTILIGIAGALLGGWAASELFDIKANGGFFDLSTWIIAIAGSVALLLIYHLVTGGGRRNTFASRFRRARR